MTAALIITLTALSVLFVFSLIHSRDKADAVQQELWGRKQVLWELRAIRLHRADHVIDEPAGRRDQVVSEHLRLEMPRPTKAQLLDATLLGAITGVVIVTLRFL